MISIINILRILSLAALTLTALFIISIKPAISGTAEASVIQQQAAKFSSPEEAKWYRTFHEGSLLVDGWQDIMKDLLATIKPSEQAQHRTVLERLGDKIGREWAKDNSIRKIDTEMLREWGKVLRQTAKKKPENLTAVIQNLVQNVKAIVEPI